MRKAFVLTVILLMAGSILWAAEKKTAADLHKQAVDLINQRDYKQAVKPLNESLKIEPNNAQAHNDLAGVYFMLNKLAQAKTEYIKAIELDPNYSQAHYNMASLCLKMEEDDEAIRHATTAQELGYKNPNIYLILGKAYFHKKMFNESLGNYEKLLPYRKDDPSVHFMLGLLYASTQNIEMAKKEFKDTLVLNPNHKAAKQELKKLEELH